MKIVAVEPIGISAERAQEIRQDLAGKGHEFVWYADRKEDPATLVERMKDAEVVMISNIPLREEVLSQCPKLQFLNVAFTGLDHIDMDYCATHNILVKNASGYATEAVAELAIGLMIDVLRKITNLDGSIRQGGVRGAFLGRELRGKTVGIVGTGAIGTRTAELLKAFGCRVIAWSRTHKPEVMNLGVAYVTLEGLMRDSDIISLHVPLNDETKHLISKEMLSLCKPTAILVNTARGNVVDMEALADSLRNGKIAGAGIDVYEKEPPLSQDHPLLNAPNCVCVPHVGYATREAFDDRIDIILGNLELGE
ncbi:MAG: hydroxyacid dehydrogenase [Bacteroidales bacterium]|nr:hydroxyacid dehydrogenase [Bacteroidales bacterium]